METLTAEKMLLEHGIIGESPEIQSVVRTAQKIAKNASITTLIIGESGTGKEVIARLLHNCSESANQPFVDINCGAIPENLLESELFGYEKGAFTGANMRKQGLFELANGGTIFLDEIGNISLTFQAKVLKAVENKRFRRINGLEEIEVSTRIIAATNVDLREAVRKGHFREDLYYRLNVCQIYVPPLRARSRDALLLAKYYVDHFNREHSRTIKGLAQSAVDFILEYEWPGNVRQLKNAMERAVLVEAEEWIHAADISIDSEIAQPPQGATVVTEVEEVTEYSPGFTRIHIPDEGISLENLERNILLTALEKAEGNVSRAARLLRINRGKFRYRLERLNISPQDVYSIKAGTHAIT